MNFKNTEELSIIFLKFSILMYCIYFYIISAKNINNVKMVLIFILIYVSVNVTANIIKKDKYKVLLHLLSLLLVLWCYIFLSKYFVLLLPISIIESFDRKNMMVIEEAVILFSIFIIYTKTNELIGIYFFVMVLSIIYHKLTYYCFEKISMLTEENDSLKEKNYGLKNSIERKKQFEDQMLYTSRLEERNKISQEMHDKLGHSISASILQLEASKMLIGKDSDRACSMIQRCIENLSDGMNAIRKTLKNIKPSSNEMGINKVKLLLDKFQSNSSISANLVYSGDIDRIDYGMWNVIYENTKEALTNVLKYSKANKVTVNIDVLNKVVKAEVKDNGIGTAKIVKGLGISGMEERTQNAGGKIIIDGGNGFSVITLLPI